MQIMLIDQDRHVRESLRLFFESEKQNFLIFKSALEGLNSLKYQKIDIVIADYFLPDMDGLTLLKEIRKKHPQILRILMATIVNDELETQIRLADIDRLLEKPLTIATLDAVLLELGQKYAARKVKNTSTDGEQND